MTVFAAGSEADAFGVVAGQSFAHESAAGRFNANTSRGAMLVTQGVSEIFLPFGGILSSAWVHFDLYQEAIVAGTEYISLRNTAGNASQYRLNIDSSGFITVERFKSAVWTALATTSAAAIVANTRQEIDIFYTRSVGSGVFQIYKDGVSLMNFTGDADTESTIDQIRFRGLTLNSQEMNVSQVIVADENTIGWKLATLPPDGNGAQTAWTGDYTAVDEFVYNPADFIETNTTNQTETVTVGDINVAFAAFNVKAVVVAARVTNDSGSAVNDLQAVVRVGGVDYVSSNLSVTKDGSDQARQNIWEVNPATSAAWTQAAVNGVEAGVKSV